MTRRIQLEKTGKEIGERIDFLREVTEALLDEVKELTPLKNNEEEVKSLTHLKNIKLDSGIDLDEEVKKIEIYWIKCALVKTGGNQRHAAQLLGLKHTTLNNKIKRYEIYLKDLYKKSAFNVTE
jgi:DNA-binding NtrC family response regulator